MDGNWQALCDAQDQYFSIFAHKDMSFTSISLIVLLLSVLVKSCIG
jgi:hypothetical protein